MMSGPPRSSPSESTTTTAPRANPAKRGTARNAASASPMRVPPSQSGTRPDALARAASGLRNRSAAVIRVSRVPRVKPSMRSDARWSTCANRNALSVCSFIEPETSTSSRIRRCPGARRRHGSTGVSPPWRTAARNARGRSTMSPRRARLRRKPRRRGSRSGASRANRRRRSMPGPAGNRRSPSSSAAVADWPDSPRSVPSDGSNAAPPSSWTRTSVSSSLSPGTGASSPWNQARNSASNSPALSCTGPSVATAARRTSSMPRGPSSSTASRNATVCSGEVVNPKPRRNGGKPARWRAGAGIALVMPSPGPARRRSCPRRSADPPRP